MIKSDTMVPYILIFCICLTITFIGEKTYKNNKLAAYICFTLSISMISIFAAIRDFNVGIDLKVYGIRLFEYSQNFDSLNEYLNLYKSEQLYQLVNYIFSHSFGNIRFFLFFMTFIQLLIIYKYSIKYNYKTVTFSLLIYLLLYFNTSLNIIRQTFAIFIIIIAFQNLKENKILKSLLLILIASYFHSSALIMITMIPIYYLSKSKNSYKKLIIILIIALSIFSGLDILLNYANHLPIFIRKYLGYIRNADTNLNVIFLIYKIIFLFFFLQGLKYCKNNKEYPIYVYFAVFDVLFYYLSSFIKYGYRLSYYFLIFYIFSIPFTQNNIENKNAKKTYTFIMIMLSIGYWILRYKIIGYDGTLPYKVF